jgi:hypothetical protein
MGVALSYVKPMLLPISVDDPAQSIYSESMTVSPATGYSISGRMVSPD